MFELFGDPQRPVIDQVLKAYEYRDKWVNRMILGDSLVVMNSLLHYESLGGQVQMIYIDPPYGVKFGSNFQPFVRKRDVTHNDDADMTREPEMVKAYRDTWELGLHSYLTYLRDRLLLARDLLHPTGSVFVQISDENVHHVRELCDEVFGADNQVALIAFAKTTGSTGSFLSGTQDFLLFYARDITRLKYRQLYVPRNSDEIGKGPYSWVELPDGTRRRMTAEEGLRPESLPQGSRIYRLDNLKVRALVARKGRGSELVPSRIRRSRLAAFHAQPLEDAMKLAWSGSGWSAPSGHTDWPVLCSICSMISLHALSTDLWDDTGIAGFASDKLYVVQTSDKTRSAAF